MHNGKLQTNLKKVEEKDIVTFLIHNSNTNIFFFFSNKRNVFYWLMDIKGPKMPRWCIADEIYEEIKFKTLDIKDDQYGMRLFIRNPDNYEELKK